MGGAPLNLDEYSRDNTLATDNNQVDDTYWSVSSDLAYTTGGGFTFRLLDGYNDWNAPQSDGDAAQFPIDVVGRNLHYQSHSNSHELQFISPKGKLLDGKLDFVAGLYYLYEDYGIDIQT